MKCVICKKNLIGIEKDNINQICHSCQYTLEKIYENMGYQDGAKRLKQLADYLKKQGGGSNDKDK